MPKTRFKPQLDGIAFPYALSFTTQEFTAFQNIIQRAVTPALDQLQQQFGPVLKMYLSESRLQQWLHDTTDEILPYAGGLVFTMLDYYFCDVSPASSVRNPSFLSQASVLAQTLHRYSWDRTQQFLQVTAETLLVWITVRNLIPVQTYPEQLFSQAIQRSIAGLKDYHDLHIQHRWSFPKHGGHRWLYAQTRKHWDTIRAAHDAGAPCAVILVNRSTRVTSQLCVLAYDYTQTSEDQITLSVFHTLDPDRAHFITMDFSGEKVGILTTLTYPGAEALQGLIHVPYAQLEPPLTATTRLLRTTLLQRVYWLFRHWLG